MGDPETEVVMPRIEGDLLEIFTLCAKGELAKASLRISDKTATTVILVSGGYPENYEKGKSIDEIPTANNSIVFHAGTSISNGKLVTSGVESLPVPALPIVLKEALVLSYQAANAIHFDGKYFRTDIGKDLEQQ
jgi:phosphoribosylamine--glycine ligase